MHPRTPDALRASLSLAAALTCAAALAACGSSAGGSPGASAGDSPAGGRRPTIVAGESFWGSIASQLAGNRAAVRSIIVAPGVDPHSYQATAQDARTVATAAMAIVNGIGYDRWMSQLLSGDSGSGAVVVDAGDVLGLGQGDNPHQWYSPSAVLKMVDAIVAGLDRVQPASASYFAAKRQFFLRNGLSEYNRLRDLIRARYAGVPVGYSESAFQPLGRDLGLKLLTPSSFAEAVAEGTDITASDKLEVDRQAQQHQIAVWVLNRQNVTPDVQQVSAIARAQQIPIVTITETLAPASDSFEQWQVAELRQLAAALHRATGR